MKINATYVSPMLRNIILKLILFDMVMLTLVKFMPLTNKNHTPSSLSVPPCCRKGKIFQVSLVKILVAGKGSEGIWG